MTRSDLAAVLFDRDGTLIVDVPYNGDPDRVRPMPTAAEALARLRGLGIPVGVVSNQSGIARGLVREEDVLAVDRRVTRLLGPFDVWRRCPHAPGAHCACRKPRPGMILSAAHALGVDPRRVAVIGDIGADVEAAAAAGATGVLVPTALTFPEEVAAARLVAPTVAAAVDLLLRRRARRADGTDGTGAAGGAGERDAADRERRPPRAAASASPGERPARRVQEVRS